MSDQWGNRGQASDPPRTEYGYLAAGVAATTTSLLLSAGSYQGFVTVGAGVFNILAAAAAVGGIGWIVRSGDTRRRRYLAKEGKQLRAGQVEVRTQLAELTSRVAELRDQIAHQRITYLPPPPRAHEGQRYIGAVAVGADDDTGGGIDPASIAAARRISSRLRSVDIE